MLILPTKCWSTCTIISQTATQFLFTGHTNYGKCNIWSLETAAIPRRVKVHHITGIANILAVSVSRIKAVGICHDIDSDDNQQEFSTPFELLPPVEPVTHTPVEVNEVIIASHIERLTQAYDTLHDPPNEQTRDNVKLLLENTSPTHIPQLKENVMSLPELTLDKMMKLQESDVFCKNIGQHISVVNLKITFKMPWVSYTKR